MKLHTICPGCGRRSSLDSSHVGKKLRCKGCEHIFVVSAAATESVLDPDVARGQGVATGGKTSGAGRARSRSQAEAFNEPGAPVDTSWLADGADGEGAVKPAPPVPRRTRSASNGDGPSLNLLIGLGAGGVVLVSLAIGLIVHNGGRGAAPRTRVKPSGEKRQAAPGLFDQVVGSFTGSSSDPVAADYPNPGPLPPPLLPPPPLRDLSEHERQARSAVAAIDRMAGILATVHDESSLKSVGEQLQSHAKQMSDDSRQNPPPFRPTPAEDAEVARRIADDMRKAIDRTRQESLRISRIPGLGIAGTQLLGLINRLSTPAELALKRAENFKASNGPAPYAEVYIQLHDDADTVVFQREFEELVEGESDKGIQSTVQSHRASFRVWPVYDLEAFSQKIPRGKATVKGRRIFVKADPIPAAELAAAKEALKQSQDARSAAFEAARTSPEEANDPQPPPDADDLTKALFALRSSRPGKRAEGVDHLARMTPSDERRDEVHKQLVALLTADDGFFVNKVMKAMVQWRTDETVPALIKVLDRSEFGVRWEAEEILGKLGDPRAAEPLAARLKEDGIKVEPALRALGSAAEPALIALLRNPDSHVRAVSCRLLKDVGGKEALETMMTLPADSDFGVQVTARDAMQTIRNRVGPISIPKKTGVTKGKSGKPG